MFQDFDVVSILKIGLTGLVFLLAYLSYKLIHKESDKAKPNKSIIVLICIFLVFSLICTGMVLFADVFKKDSREEMIMTPPSEVYWLKRQEIDLPMTKYSTPEQLDIGKLQHEYDALMRMLQDDLIENDSLRQVIENMANERLHDLNTARSLEKRVNRYLTTGGKVNDSTLDRDLYNFLSLKAHPNLKEDFVNKANTLAITGILADKNLSIEKKDSIIAELTHRNAGLYRDLANSRDIAKSLQEQLDASNDSIESISNHFNDALLEMQAKYAKQLRRADSLSEITNNTNPMRFDNLEFKPKGVPARADYTYKTGLIKDGLIVSFTLNQNVTLQSQRQDTATVRVVFTVNNTTYKPYDYVAPVGKFQTVDFKPDMPFPSGLYSVQISCPYLKGRPVIYSFQARKWTERPK